MTWIALGILVLILFGLCAILTKDERARQKRISIEIQKNLEDLFYECIYPGYASGAIYFESSFGRRNLIWGPWIIKIVVAYRTDIHTNVEDIVFQRLLRLVGEQYLDQAVLVKPIFVKRRGESGRESESSTAQQRRVV